MVMPLPWPPRANANGGLMFQAHLYRPELLRPRHVGQSGHRWHRRRCGMCDDSIYFGIGRQDVLRVG
eukprot:2146551-Prymnesium_polylepis.1